MDRISALRNVEEALGELERGETDLASAEARVCSILRTYATEYDGELAAWRASGDPAAEGVVVLAASEREARERVATLVGVPEARVTVSRRE
ncbi:hypothetical protein J2752_001086 [Halarchaeum rubridurum]|uniref:Uncharacterized protein n=1 Tax=Halarchaeum rubridurum TaxID=489911 RepID=A0A830FY62_9EURY|nr:hypothetical protein [Halarchaeum rubridurum]MBP1954205.1 hypothetical protein [Halarchaeum rubridurum]GGM58161.1 hypothetical protein GCM10009017_05400 [Halarchaeum rubridurum]